LQLKKFPQIRPGGTKRSPGKMLAKLYFGAEIRTRIGVSNQRGPRKKQGLKEI
jgi:hypothetical protein